MSDHNPGLRPWRDIARRQCRQIMVGNVPVGGDAPVSVQTMTNTPTHDVKATIDQIRRCEEVGVDIIRVSCPDEASTAALKQIVRAARSVVGIAHRCRMYGGPHCRLRQQSIQSEEFPSNYPRGIGSEELECVWQRLHGDFQAFTDGVER